MLLELFTVRDVKAEVYLPPFTFRHKGEAVRAFEQSLQDRNTTMGQFPQDYVLFRLGTYDDVSANFDLHAVPEFIMNGDIILNRRNRDNGETEPFATERDDASVFQGAAGHDT